MITSINIITTAPSLNSLSFLICELSRLTLNQLRRVKQETTLPPVFGKELKHVNT